MPFSFTKIEQDRTSTIRRIFTFLVFFYLASFIVLAIFLKVIISCWMVYGESLVNEQYACYDLSYFFQPLNIGVLLFMAFGFGSLHWSISTRQLVRRITARLRAKPLNLQDPYHNIFHNILAELSAATGGQLFEGYIIPSTSLNAFAISDFFKVTGSYGEVSLSAMTRRTNSCPSEIGLPGAVEPGSEPC